MTDANRRFCCLTAAGMTSYTPFMKTAISIPDDLFEEVERFSRRLKVSRSRLFTEAAREYLARQAAPAEATMLWNKVVSEAGQPGDEPASVAVRRRSKAALRQGLTKRR
jgi:hypothetical protein